MASTITSQVASALIASGKAAVSAELSRIEADIVTAINKSKAEASTIATELAVHLDSHAAEVATAQALLAHANLIQRIVPDSAATAAPAQPAKSLTTSTNIFAEGLAWIKSNGWKGWTVLVIGLLVVRYLFVSKII